MGVIFLHAQRLRVHVWHRYSIELNTGYGIEPFQQKENKNPTDFYKNHHDYRMDGCQLNQYNENTVSSMRQRKFYISE